MSGIAGWHAALVIGVILVFLAVAAAFVALVVWLARRSR